MAVLSLLLLSLEPSIELDEPLDEAELALLADMPTEEPPAAAVAPAKAEVPARARKKVQATAVAREMGVMGASSCDEAACQDNAATSREHGAPRCCALLVGDIRQCHPAAGAATIVRSLHVARLAGAACHQNGMSSSMSSKPDEDDGAGAGRPAAGARGGRTAGRFIATTTAAVAALVTTAHALSAAQHLHGVATDFSGIAIGAALILPLARAQAAFDVHLRTLAQILCGNLGQAAIEHHGMPFRVFAHLAALLVLPLVGGGNAHVADLVATRESARFGVAAQVADDDDFVDGGHGG
jgi:hypothetical protein